MHISEVEAYRRDKEHLMRTEGKHPANYSHEEKTAAQLNAQIAERFREYNEPDKSIFGSVGSNLRREERQLELREKYRKEDEGK